MLAHAGADLIGWDGIRITDFNDFSMQKALKQFDNQ
jgi:hypothetical protein